jgi:hypothetical protein
MTMIIKISVRHVRFLNTSPFRGRQEGVKLGAGLQSCQSFNHGNHSSRQNRPGISPEADDSTHGSSLRKVIHRITTAFGWTLSYGM